MTEQEVRERYRAKVVRAVERYAAEVLRLKTEHMAAVRDTQGAAKAGIRRVLDDRALVCTRMEVEDEYKHVNRLLAPISANKLEAARRDAEAALLLAVREAALSRDTALQALEKE